MESSIVYGKTPLGVVELSGAHGSLSLQARQLLIMIDGERSFDELCELFGEERASRTLSELKSRGFVQRKATSNSRSTVSAGGAPPTLTGERFRSSPPTIEQPLSDFPEVLESTPAKPLATTRLRTQPGAPPVRPTASTPTWSAPTLSSTRAAPPGAAKAARSSLAKAVTVLGFIGCAAIILVGALRLRSAPDAPPAVVQTVEESASPGAPKPIVFQAPDVEAPPPVIAPRATRPTVRATASAAAPPAPVAAATARAGADASPSASPGADLASQAGAPAPASPVVAAPVSTPSPPPVVAMPALANVERTQTKPEPASATNALVPEERTQIAKASVPVPAAPAVQAQLPAPLAASALHVRNRVLPTISARAKRAGITEGSIEVILDVNPSGTVDRVELVSANPARIYDGQMQDALQQWTFDPPGGRARARIAFEFKP